MPKKRPKRTVVMAGLRQVSRNVAAETIRLSRVRFDFCTRSCAGLRFTCDRGVRTVVTERLRQVSRNVAAETIRLSRVRSGIYTPGLARHLHATWFRGTLCGRTAKRLQLSALPATCKRLRAAGRCLSTRRQRNNTNYFFLAGFAAGLAAGFFAAGLAAGLAGAFAMLISPEITAVEARIIIDRGRASEQFENLIQIMAEMWRGLAGL